MCKNSSPLLSNNTGLTTYAMLCTNSSHYVRIQNLEGDKLKTKRKRPLKKVVAVKETKKDEVKAVPKRQVYRIIDTPPTRPPLVLKPVKPRRHETIPEDPQTLLSVSQAARFLGVSRNTIYKWMQSAFISGMRMGRDWKFERKKLLEEVSQIYLSLPKRGYRTN